MGLIGAGFGFDSIGCSCIRKGSFDLLGEQTVVSVGQTGNRCILQIHSHMLEYAFHIGRYFLMLFQMLRPREKFRIYWAETIIDFTHNGLSSIGLVVIISTFVGAVLTVQTAYQLEGSYFPITIIGSVVSASALLEMAPTVTCLVLAGKIGSNIASQIGTMRITEQIDALEVMGINSIAYLILPKVVAAIIAFPCLVVVAAFFTVSGGLVAGQVADIIQPADFIFGAQKFHRNYFVLFMCVKALTFGFLITTISAYQGYYVKGGAVNVGASSTKAVVYSCIMILVMNYVLAKLML